MPQNAQIDNDAFPLIDKFAREHSLRRAVVRDSCGEQLIVPGRPPKPRPEDCCHIFEHAPGQLAVSLVFHSARAWNSAKARLLSLGFALHQGGDTEGIMLFDPGDPAQAKAAIRETKARRQTQLSADERARRSGLMKKFHAAPLVGKQVAK